MHIRITIEYDPDCPDNMLEKDYLKFEERDWLNEVVTINDVLNTNGVVKFEIVAAPAMYVEVA